MLNIDFKQSNVSGDAAQRAPTTSSTQYCAHTASLLLWKGWKRYFRVPVDVLHPGCADESSVVNSRAVVNSLG